MKPGAVSASTFALAGAVCLASCSTPPPVITRSTTTIEAVVNTPVQRSTASIVALRLPVDFRLDGDVSEWGRLQPTATIPDEPEHRFPRVGALGQPTLQPDMENAAPLQEADVRVAVAISPTGLSLAVDFGESQRDSLTIGLASVAPDSSPLAYVPAEGDWEEPSLPAERAELVPHPLQIADFSSVLRISASGITRLSQGQTHAVVGAKIVFNPQRRSLEAVLPLEVLPRLVEAPLESLRMAVDANGGNLAEDIAKAPWRWVKLEEPATFEPFGTLRAKILALVMDQGPAGGAGISYHPAQPLELQSVDRSAAGYGKIQPVGVLFAKQAQLGDVEVGLGFAHTPFVAARKAGATWEVALLTYSEEGFNPPKQGALSDGVVLGIVERGQQVDIITYAESALHQQFKGQFISAHFMVYSVKKDGKIRNWHCSPDLSDDAFPSSLSGGVPYFDSAFTSFGLKDAEVAVRPSGSEAVELQCRWDDRNQRYAAKTITNRIVGKR